MELVRNIYRISVKISEGKRPHRPYRQKGNIKIGLEEVQCEYGLV
jgi:hypothetical protein